MEQVRDGQIEVGFVHKGLDDFLEQMQRVFNRLVIALIVTGGLIGSSLIGIFAKTGPHLLGINAISVRRLCAFDGARRVAALGRRSLPGAVVSAAHLQPVGVPASRERSPAEPASSYESGPRSCSARAVVAPPSPRAGPAVANGVRDSPRLSRRRKVSDARQHRVERARHAVAVDGGLDEEACVAELAAIGGAQEASQLRIDRPAAPRRLVLEHAEGIEIAVRLEDGLDLAAPSARTSSSSRSATQTWKSPGSISCAQEDVLLALVAQSHDASAVESPRRKRPIACAPPIGTMPIRSLSRSRPRRAASVSRAIRSLTPSTSTTVSTRALSQRDACREEVTLSRERTSGVHASAWLPSRP